MLDTSITQDSEYITDSDLAVERFFGSNVSKRTRSESKDRRYRHVYCAFNDSNRLISISFDRRHGIFSTGTGHNYRQISYNRDNFEKIWSMSGPPLPYKIEELPNDWVIGIDIGGGGGSYDLIVYSPDIGEIYQENCAGVYARPVAEWNLTTEQLAMIQQIRANEIVGGK